MHNDFPQQAVLRRNCLFSLKTATIVHPSATSHRDEPSLGLAPSVVDDISTSIQKINAAGTAVLMVEQNIQKAFQIAHRGYVLENGPRLVLQDTAKGLLANPDVQRAYLGI
jgi:ABC-type branched-subunit amino acid transport system ATPase component